MIRAALCLCATPVCADTLACTMEDGRAVAFTIDRSQFVTAVSPEEPIRRKVTTVRFGAATFPAEPFLIGEMRGFHAKGLGDSDAMFVAQPDGSATFTNRREGIALSGQCEFR